MRVYIGLSAWFHIKLEVASYWFELYSLSFLHHLTVAFWWIPSLTSVSYWILTLDLDRDRTIEEVFKNIERYHVTVRRRHCGVAGNFTTGISCVWLGRDGKAQMLLKLANFHRCKALFSCFEEKLDGSTNGRTNQPLLKVAWTRLKKNLPFLKTAL